MDIENNNSNIIPCSLEEVESHLRAFIVAFILPQAQTRWQEFLINKRSEWDVMPRTPRNIKIYHKADEIMRHFAAEPRFCVRVPNPQRTPSYFEATFGKTLGVYFALGTLPQMMSANDANKKFTSEDTCAMLSFLPGKKALFFCHDGGVWKCERE